MPDNTLSTLDQIKIKVRRLTKSPSTSQITDATIESYINTFVLYDFPEHLRLSTLRKTISFYTQPYIDTYEGDDIATNFNNIYTNIYGNAYVAGCQQAWFQDRVQFYTTYPKIENVKSIGTKGDGVTVNYTGTLTPVSILRNHLSFTSINASNVGLEVHDVPNDPNDGEGIFAGDIGAAGSINYTTGVYDITFDDFPATGKDIYSQHVAYTAGRPNSILYYDSKLVFRPVPDKSYRVELEVATRPTELLDGVDMPELSQWWEYIAYGAAKKVFEDRMDMESVQNIMPEFKKQETLVNRKTIDQQSKERTATIYNNLNLDNSKLFNG